MRTKTCEEVLRLASHNLRTLARHMGVSSMAEFARAFGFPANQVREWFKGNYLMPARHAQVIHERYPNISVAWLRGMAADRDEAIKELLDENDELRRRIGELERQLGAV